MGALVEVYMDAAEARGVTDRIKVGVEAVWDLIKQAYTGRAWAALGYESWDDYCTREFGTSRLRLPREERSEVVASLRESGLSLRAIASATGISHEEARRSLNPPVTNVTPDIKPLADVVDAVITEAEQRGDTSNEGIANVVKDAFGSVREQSLPPLPENYMGFSPDEVPAAPAQPTPVTGLDGKTYSPQPKKKDATPRRRPLSDSAREIGLDLKNITARLERLLADDRFARNKNEVAPHLRFHLAQAIKVCQDLESQIN